MTTLVIPDIHLPFQRRGAIQFLKKQQKRFGAKRVVAIGDVVDNHALSRFVKDPAEPNVVDELRAVRRTIRAWYAAFPKLYACEGNHDLRLVRKAVEAGIPREMVRDHNELWGTPGWRWADSWQFDGVMYTHGTGSSGPTAALRRAKDARQSVVMGHTHSFGGIIYHASKRDLIFGLNVGCVLDPSGYAFEYGKDAPNRPVVGCGIVVSSSEAYFVPMKLK